MLKILLMIVAWRNGWRWRAMLPVGIFNSLAVVLMVADALSFEGLVCIALVDLAALAWMSFVKPAPARGPAALAAAGSR